jgi:hypothetical protein
MNPPGPHRLLGHAQGRVGPAAARARLEAEDWAGETVAALSPIPELEDDALENSQQR